MLRNAPSTETGESAAKMPTSFIMTSPGLGEQSQYCVISLAKLTYDTLPFLKVESTPYAADASALQRFALCVNFMAPVGHACEHAGQREHKGETFLAFSPIISGKLSSHVCLHLPQPMHLDSSISKPTVLCCRSLPAREAHPIPKFFMAPPKPLSSRP